MVLPCSGGGVTLVLPWCYLAVVLPCSGGGVTLVLPCGRRGDGEEVMERR